MQLLLYVLFHHYRVWNAVKQIAQQCTTELHNLLWEGLRERARSGPSAVPPACTVHQPSPEWARITPHATASITPHTRCLFSGTLLYLPLPNWEWMSAHRGVENNGWGQLGTLSAKHHGDLCLPDKTEHAHSIMWQSKTKQSMFLYGRQLNQQATVLSSF